jgi:hypothetical protein
LRVSEAVRPFRGRRGDQVLLLTDSVKEAGWGWYATGPGVCHIIERLRDPRLL